MKWTTIGVMAVALLCATGGSAPAAPVLGAQLYYTGGDIDITVLPATAGYVSELRLYYDYPDTTSSLFIALNTNVGTTITLDDATDLAGFSPGDELVFGIYVRDTGYTYFIGPAGRNPDGEVHTGVDVLGTGPFVANVGFEDLYGGGDRDYDDNVFRFEGALDSNAVPEPASLTLLAIGNLALFGYGWRRRNARA